MKTRLLESPLNGGQGLWASLNSTVVGSHLSGMSVRPPSCHAEGWGLGAPVGNISTRLCHVLKHGEPGPS